jgi:hypothetical protein
MSIPSNANEIINEYFTTGSVNHRGLLEGNNSLGFTTELNITELDANSKDAFIKLNTMYLSEYQPKILWDVKLSNSYISDNASGMTRQDLEHFWDYFCQNHANDITSGRSGIGGKVALQLLSNQTEVEGFTSTLGGELLYFKVPFKQMLETGEIKDMIKFRTATIDEKSKIYNYYKDNKMLNQKGEFHGTQFIFPKNEELRDILSENYKEPALCNLNPLYREGVVFGNEVIEFIYKDFETGEHQLTMYDYFGGNKTDYYLGFDENIIEVWQDLKKPTYFRFLSKNDNNEYIEYPKSGSGIF